VDSDPWLRNLVPDPVKKFLSATLGRGVTPHPGCGGRGRQNWVFY
jgi:hypothetical protein